MIHVVVTWQEAAIAAGAVGALGVLIRRWPVAAAVLKEAALVLGLYSLWQFAGTFSVLPAGGAYPRGEWIWQAERTLHLPNELTLQRLVLPHHRLVEFFNGYYLVHFPALIALLLWLFLRHRSDYRRWRNVLVWVTGLSLAVQLIPVAPPRLLSGAGFVDTGVLYHQSVYTTIVMADQLSAMPSVHVIWAVLVALAVIRISRSRWRWLVIAHPVLTTVCVVVTANHFWLDGVAGVVLLGLVFAARRISRMVTSSYRPRRAAAVAPFGARPAAPAPATLELTGGTS